MSGSSRRDEPIKLNITVRIAAEGEGTSANRSEYEIESQLIDGRKVVRRSYKDCVDFGNCLLKRYFYRVVPTLPPKQPTAESSIQAWLTVVYMHPILGSSPMLKAFLTATSDYRNQLQQIFEREMKYYASQLEDFSLPMPKHTRLVMYREPLQNKFNSLNKLYKILDDQSHPTEQQTITVDGILRDLNVVGLRGSDICAANISRSDQATAQRHDAKERLKALLYLLIAYFYLWNRVEKEFPSEMDTGPAVGSTYDRARRKCAYARRSVLLESDSVETLLMHLPAILFAYANKEVRRPEANNPGSSANVE